MDILIAKISYHIGWLTILIWISGVVCWGVILLLTRQRKKFSVEKLVKMMAVGIGLFLGSMFVSVWLLDHFANERLETFAHGQIHSFDITFEGRNKKIEDPTVIREFWSIICSARKVWGHHSQPVEEISLFLPEIGYTYSLGKDSDVVDEFWLKWVSYPGSNPNTTCITIAKQFRSPELSKWLQRHELVSFKRKASD